jgi:hypothetical protein
MAVGQWQSTISALNPLLLPVLELSHVFLKKYCWSLEDGKYKIRFLANIFIDGAQALERRLVSSLLPHSPRPNTCFIRRENEL